MGIGVSVVLVAVGAILSFAMTVLGSMGGRGRGDVVVEDRTR